MPKRTEQAATAARPHPSARTSTHTVMLDIQALASPAHWTIQHLATPRERPPWLACPRSLWILLSSQIAIGACAIAAFVIAFRSLVISASFARLQMVDARPPNAVLPPYCCLHRPRWSCTASPCTPFGRFRDVQTAACAALTNGAACLVERSGESTPSASRHAPRRTRHEWF